MTNKKVSSKCLGLTLGIFFNLSCFIPKKKNKNNKSLRGYIE